MGLDFGVPNKINFFKRRKLREKKMNFQIKKIFDSFPKLILVAFFIGIVIPFPAKGQSPTPENMVLVNAGGFIRGVDADSGKTNSDQTKVLKEKLSVSKNSFEDESPARMIYLSSYFIDKYEVSNAQYKEFMRSTDHAAPAYWDHRHLNIPKNPVTGVNWFDANGYCRWNKKRLPTEAEWEKAARGPAGLTYPWGNTLDIKKANFSKGNTGKKMVTTAIDSYPDGKSYYGAYNMAGNVFEWVQDWYDPDYYKNMQNVRNVKGPQIGLNLGAPGKYDEKIKYGQKKVIRGGSWFAPAESITTTHRFWNDPMNNSYGVGLGIRCARDIKENSGMIARTYYMDALVEMGAEKFKRAYTSINKALNTNPDNTEYKNLKELIKKRGNL
jgi:formylglycine-generating enzyme required for sulfatase activity|tara:strand:+ start:2504 stop:3652 length:1149 start_codon:yes stop_codon:yes gene_type:complete